MVKKVDLVFLLAKIIWSGTVTEQNRTVGGWWKTISVFNISPGPTGSLNLAKLKDILNSCNTYNSVNVVHGRIWHLGQGILCVESFIIYRKYILRILSTIEWDKLFFINCIDL